MSKRKESLTANLVNMHKSLSECYKRTAQQRLVELGVIGQVSHANTFQEYPSNRKGYDFRLMDGRAGRVYLLNDGSKELEWVI